MMDEQVSVGTECGKIRLRLAACAVIVALHLVLMALLLQPPNLQRVTPVPIAAMTIAAVLAPHVLAPNKLDLPLDAHLTAPSFDVAEPPNTAKSVCNVLADLQKTLATGPVATTLSTAATGQHAVMAWNGTWPDAPEALPLHRAVVAVLAVAPAECLDEILVGPRLIFVPAQSSIVTVAFGSGSWSWRMLL